MTDQTRIKATGCIVYGDTVRQAVSFRRAGAAIAAAPHWLGPNHALAPPSPCNCVRNGTARRIQTAKILAFGISICQLIFENIGYSRH
jgi:hypothetical protein